jgi:hypothetical protein
LRPSPCVQADGQKKGDECGVQAHVRMVTVCMTGDEQLNLLIYLRNARSSK